MNGTRRPVSRRPVRRSRKTTGSAQLIRLCAALGIVLTAFCMKLAFPGQTEVWLRDTVGHGIDLRESVSAIGAGLREVFRPVRPELPAADAASTAAPEDTTEAPEPEATPEPTEPPPPEPSELPDASGSNPWAIGSLMFDDQLLSAAARPIVALEDGLLVTDPEEDDTPPIPFGLTVPENADYTRYTLPFDCAAPVDGARTSGYGWRMHPIDNVMKFHYGVDLAAAQGTAVRSFAAGRVSAVGNNGSYGRYVLVEHAGGYATLYAHLSSVTVKAGASVKLGDTVGKAGQTGKATGPHLHFELRGLEGSPAKGKLIDPTPYL